MKNNIKFAFLVHSRDRSDLLRKFPFLEILPTYIYDLLTLNLPPFIVSRITGLVDSSNNKIDGLIIGVPMTAHQLTENRSLASKKIIQATRIAKKAGASYVGLGAMTSSLTRGGKDIIENVSGIYITTGRTYTIKNISEYVDYCVNRFSLDKNIVRIGIVGAAGGIGSGTAIALARKNYKNFLLIDLERKLMHLEKKIEDIENHAQNLSIRVSHQISHISECDIIIAATNAPEVVIKSEDLSPGTIIINDAQPSDVSPEILKLRNDVLVIEGGVLTTKNINCNFNLGLSNKNDIFSCLAETLIIAHKNSDTHYSIDDFDKNLYYELEEVGKKLEFKIDKLQNQDGYIDDARLNEFQKIINYRKS